MKCSHIKKMMFEHLEGSLSPKEEESFTGHIAECEACRKELELHEKTWQGMDVVQGIEPSPGYMGEFWKRAALEPTWQERVTAVLEDIYLKKKVAYALVSMMLLITVGSHLFRGYVTQTPYENGKYLPEDIEIAENLDLLYNLEIIEDIDLLEDIDILERLNGAG